MAKKEKSICFPKMKTKNLLNRNIEIDRCSVTIENSAFVSVTLAISHLSAVNNIFYVLLLRKHKSVYVNEFVVKDT